MSFLQSHTIVDLKSRGITTETLMDILDIEKVSAVELLDGIIPLTRNEMEEIAHYKGISLEALIE